MTNEIFWFLYPLQCAMRYYWPRHLAVIKFYIRSSHNERGSCIITSRYKKKSQYHHRKILVCACVQSRWNHCRPPPPSSYYNDMSKKMRERKVNNLSVGTKGNATACTYRFRQRAIVSGGWQQTSQKGHWASLRCRHRRRLHQTVI